MSPKVHPMSPIIFNSDSIYVGKWCAESVSKEYLPNSLKESFFFMLTYFPRSYMYHKKVRAIYTQFTKCSLLYQKKAERKSISYSQACNISPFFSENRNVWTFLYIIKKNIAIKLNHWTNKCQNISNKQQPKRKKNQIV